MSTQDGEERGIGQEVPLGAWNCLNCLFIISCYFPPIPDSTHWLGKVDIGVKEGRNDSLLLHLSLLQPYPKLNIHVGTKEAL